MNKGAMRIRVYNALPQATSATIPASVIDTELNNGMNKVGEDTECYRGTFNCNTQAGIGQYSLSAICPGYINIWKPGIWFFNSSGESQILYPKTKKWLDNFLINWRDSSPVEIPTWVVIDGDTLIFEPAPSGVNQFTVDAVKYGTPMTNDANYPWNNSSSQELTSLRPMDDAIIAYAIWKLAPAVFDNEGRNYYEGQYEKRVQEGMKKLRRRWDMTSSFDYYIRLDMQTGFLPRY